MKTTLFTCFIVVANLSLQIFAAPIFSRPFPQPPEEVFDSPRKEVNSGFNRNQVDATLGRNNFMNRFGVNQNVHDLPNPDDSHLSSIVKSVVSFCGNGKMSVSHETKQLELGNRLNINVLSELTENEVVFGAKAIVNLLRISESQIYEKSINMRESMKFRLSSESDFHEFERLDNATSIALADFNSMINRWSQPGKIENFVRLYKNDIPSGIEIIIKMMNLWRVNRFTEEFFNEMENLRPNYQ